MRPWNVAVITTTANSNPINGDTAVRAISHELGHAAGASHTCCLGSNCLTDMSCSHIQDATCNPKDNYYLMYPLLTYGTNSLLFSPCSVESIEAWINAKGSCLITQQYVLALSSHES